MSKGLDILIVVDYQNDFVDGALGFKEAERLDDGIASLMKEYINDVNKRVICTLDTHTNDYLNTNEGKHIPTKHCIFPSNGWELHGKVGEVEKNNTEYVKCITKNTFGSLNSGNYLEGLNRRSKIDTIKIVGVVTNLCVISTAIIAKSACPEAEIIVESSLCAGPDKAMSQKAIDVMKEMGIKVV